MKDLKLVALVSGNRKDGTGKWYRATLKGHNTEGKPIVDNFYLDDSVAEKAVQDGIVEDCAVNVTFDLDEFMRPVISSLTKVSTTGSSKAQVTV